ncbi:MAG: TerB family tellurite resistance protein [Alphaproteobacteria bacterium]|nr:TerB family tellurite resistance protein [Alphaproteobacteria bacterium]
MQQYRKGDPDLSSNRFHMWRAIIGIAHADNLVHPDERNYLETIIGNMHRRGYLDDAWREQLLADIDHPPEIVDMLRQINDPVYRGQIVTFARILAWKDGHLHPDEGELLERLHAHAMGGLDFEAIREDVRRNISQETLEHDIAVESFRPDRGLSGLLDRFLAYFGNDLMDG